MKVRAIDRKLLRDLVKLRGQAIAVSLVVACGLATLVTTWTAYRSLLHSQQSYYATNRFADVFVSLKRAPNSLRHDLARIPGVTAVETRVITEVTLDVEGLDEPATGRVVSIPDRRIPILNDLFLRSGRWVERGHPEEIVISESFAKANGLGPGDSIGAVINGRWRRLAIVGVGMSPEFIYEIRGGELLPDSRRFGVIWMGHRAISSALTMEGAFNDVVFTVSPRANLDEVVARIDDILAPYGGTGAYDRELHPSHKFLDDEIKSNRVTGTVMPTIFLGVAAFLINIVLARLVQTQRDQIAVLKAFGYSNRDIGMHFVKFALVIIIAGALLGSAMGAWLASVIAEIYTDFYHLPYLEMDFDPLVFAIGIAVSALAAIGGALTAVRGAVRLPPAEAMRPEAPPVFKPGVVERLGLFRYMSAAGRIIARNLARRRLKAAMSIAGVAMAAAILLVGRYMYDAMDELMIVQFDAVQLEDVSVSFREPNDRSVAQDLAHLPGVMRVEPFRVVPVKIVAGHRTRRTALTGLPADTILRGLIDRDRRAIQLPADGLALSATLADILGVAVGDMVRVEILEGQRRKVDVQVTRLVDEFIGTASYMDDRALARLLRENLTVSGAMLMVDPAAQDELNRVLKSTPAIAGVSSRDAMITSFEETIRESMLVSTFFIVIFACVIAVGVVYNGARIALSERGRELASLRVLGFSRGEVAWMLLGEQGLLTLAAVPFGFGIGYLLCAGIAQAFSTELYRFPLLLTQKTYAFAFGVILLAAIFSGAIVYRRIRSLDLVEVLKTRE